MIRCTRFLIACWVIVALVSRGLAEELPRKFTSKASGIEFVLIPAGEFNMGARLSLAEIERRFGKPGFPREYPVHRVQVDSFYMAAKEVTRGQWKKFVRATRYKTTAEHARAKHHWLRSGVKQTDRHPVAFISYQDAVEFAAWLSRKDGRTYRLPTEAEWEYACRAGTDTFLWWGAREQLARKFANLAGKEDGFQRTAPVASFQPNPWGLYDMIGNVWEWCGDWVGEAYYQDSPARNPKGPDRGEFRAYRGGSWDATLWNGRAGHRNRQPPDAFYNNSGFRLVIELPATEERSSPPRELNCDLEQLSARAGSKRASLAVLDFAVSAKSGRAKGRALSDLCRVAVHQSAVFTLIDRENMAAILGEQDLAAAMGCDSSVCRVEYGKLLSAQSILHGRVSKLGGSFVLYLSLTDVETARIKAAVSKQDTSIGKLADAVPDLTCRLLRQALSN